MRTPAGSGSSTSSWLPSSVPSSVAPNLLVDLGDLRSLHAEPSHQAPLIEDECIDVLRQRGTRHRLAHALVDHHDAGSDADLPAVALVEVLERAAVHEEQG